MRRSAIKLITKGGKDLTKLNNWRPLSLLNASYKIFAKILTNRILLVIDDILEPEQNAYIQGRSNFNNVRTILEAIKYSENNNEGNLLISLDFNKCFDAINRDFYLGMYGIYWIRKTLY